MARSGLYSQFRGEDAKEQIHTELWAILLCNRAEISVRLRHRRSTICNFICSS